MVDKDAVCCLQQGQEEDCNEVPKVLKLGYAFQGRKYLLFEQ